MYESNRLYPYVVPGYTGHIPSKEDCEGYEFSSGLKSEIPGYAGYIPKIKPENMFGCTYGKLTYSAATADQHKHESPSDRYKTTIKESFVNQTELLKTLRDPTKSGEQFINPNTPGYKKSHSPGPHKEADFQATWKETENDRKIELSYEEITKKY